MAQDSAMAVDLKAFVDQQNPEQKLTWLQERGFEEAYDSSKRRLWLACLLAAALGFIGAHRFYLGKHRTAILMLATTLAGSSVATFISTFFRNTVVGVAGNLIAGLILLAVCVWVVADLFRIPAMVRKFNARLSMEIKLKLCSGFFI